jgi:hypothetical protein
MKFAQNLTADQRAQLLQVYTIERQDNQTSAIVAFAILAAGLTYMVASSAFFLSRCDRAGCRGLPDEVQLLSPLVLYGLISFLVLNVAATIMRAKHIRKLEQMLEIRVSPAIWLPSFHRDSSDIYEVKFKLNWLQCIYAPVTFFTYVPVLVIITFFTIGVLIPGAWTWDKKLILIVYLIITALQVGGMLLPLFHPRFKEAFVSDPPGDNKEGAN